MKKNECIILVILTCKLLFGADSQGKSKGAPSIMNTKPQNTNLSTSYSTYFGGLARSSFQNVLIEPEGKVVWSNDIESYKIKNIFCMVTLGDVLILDAGTYAVGLDQQGKVRWMVPKNPSSPVFVSGNSAWFLNNSYRLLAVDEEGAYTYKNIAFPEASSFDHTVSLLKTDQQSYLAVVQFSGGPESKPLVSVSRTPYDEFISTWVNHYSGRQASLPLWNESGGHLWLALSDVRVIEEKSGKVITQFPFPFDSLISWSLANDGCAILFGKKDRNHLLVSISDDSKVKWNWVADEGLRLHYRQPPMIGNDGRIFLIADEGIVSIDTSRTHSIFHCENGEISFCTVLLDGKMLVSAGNSLCIMSTDGNFRLLADFGSLLVSTPVTYGKGLVAVATKKKLLCIR